MSHRLTNLFGIWMRCVGAVVLALVFAPPAHALQITDDRGLTVSFDKTPQRIVSVLPSLTESVCALGQCARLVGVDRYSNYPARVRSLPQVGGGLDPNVEAIVALKPDVVLIATSARVGERLAALGLKVVALEPKRLKDVQRVLGILGQLLAVPDAPRVWQSIDAEVTAAAQSVPAHAKAQRVYFEVNSGPYGASEASFIGELLTRLGVGNIVPGKLGPFPQLNPEFVVRANPDVIMVGDRNAQNMLQRPGWSGITAIKTGRICHFSVAQADVLVRAGPRMAEGARLMAQCIAGQMTGQMTEPHD